MTSLPKVCAKTLRWTPNIPEVEVVLEGYRNDCSVENAPRSQEANVLNPRSLTYFYSLVEVQF